MRWHMPSPTKGRGSFLPVAPLHRSTLAEVANVAAFMASNWAGAMTGTVVNLTCGSIAD